MGFQALHAQQQIGKLRLYAREDFTRVQVNGMGKYHFFLRPVIRHASVIQKKRRVDREAGQLRPEHGETPAGVDGKGSAIVHKPVYGLQIGLRDFSVRAGQSAVKIYGHQDLRKNAHTHRFLFLILQFRP